MWTINQLTIKRRDLWCLFDASWMHSAERSILWYKSARWGQVDSVVGSPSEISRCASCYECRVIIAACKKSCLTRSPLIKDSSRSVQWCSKRWFLGCVKLRPAARGSQYGGFTQPRSKLLEHLCIFFESVKMKPTLSFHMKGYQRLLNSTETVPSSTYTYMQIRTE